MPGVAGQERWPAGWSQQGARGCGEHRTWAPELGTHAGWSGQHFTTQLNIGSLARSALPCRLVDEVVWVKMTVNRRLAKSHGFYLQHAKEVGMPCWGHMLWVASQQG